MSEAEPRTQIETCLVELQRNLTARGVTVTAIRDQDGKACLEVYDRYARRRRVHVFTQFFWFVWGEDPDERGSVFQPAETAERLAHLALGPGWLPEQDLGDLTRVLDQFLR
jgi:hypothetical protein